MGRLGNLLEPLLPILGAIAGALALATVPGWEGGFCESATGVFTFSFSEDHESCRALSIAAVFEASTVLASSDVFHDFVLICSAGRSASVEDGGLLVGICRVVLHDARMEK